MIIAFSDVPVGGTFSSKSPVALYMKTVESFSHSNSMNNSVKICLSQYEDGQGTFKYFADSDLVFYTKPLS